MASITKSQPTVHSLINLERAPEMSAGSVFKAIKPFKNPYLGIGVVLGWAEKFVSFDTAKFIREQNAIVRTHYDTFDLPELIEDGIKFPEKVQAIGAAKTEQQRKKAIKEGVINAVDLANTGMNVAKCLHYTDIIDLEKYSPTLPVTLTKMGIAARLILRGTDLINSFKKWKNIKTEGGVLPHSVNSVQRNKKGWLMLDVARSIGSLAIPILSGMVHFLGVAVSTQWTPCIFTFLFATSLLIEISKIVRDV